MYYILIGVVIFALLFLIPLLFGVLTDLTKKQIAGVYSGVAIVIAIVVLFSVAQESKQSKNLEVMKAFQRGDVVICNEIEVSQKEYNLVIGTLNFLGKNGTNSAGNTFKIEDCIVKQ